MKEAIAQGAGWGLWYDAQREETWLSIDKARATGVSYSDGAPYTPLEVELPEELAELIDTAWQNRPRPVEPASLRIAVLSIFTQSRWGAYSAEGVWRIAHGMAVSCVYVLPNIGAASAQDIQTTCEQLVEEGLLIRHQVRNSVSYELAREKFPIV